MYHVVCVRVCLGGGGGGGREGGGGTLHCVDGPQFPTQNDTTFFGFQKSDNTAF